MTLKTRGSPDFLATPSSWNWETWSGGSSDSGGSTAVSDHSIDYEESRGETLPHFNRRRRAGELLPFTNWLQYKVTGEYDGELDVRYDYDPTSGFHNWTTGVRTYKPTGPLGSVEILKLVDLDRMSYVAQGALANIYARGFDAGTFAAELAETIAMFKGFTKRLIVNLSRFRADNIWLEWRYGWRTLLYDMQDIENAINSVDSGLKRVRGQKGYSDEYSEDLSLDTDYYGGAYCCGNLWRRDGIRRITLRYHGAAVADVDPPEIYVNPLVTGWEIITLSFVVDWVYNIGQFLMSLSTVAIARGTVQAGGCKVTVVTSSYGSWTTKGDKYSGNSWDSSAFSEELTIRRPASPLSAPHLALNLNVGRITDLLALLGQVLTRR